MHSVVVLIQIVLPRESFPPSLTPWHQAAEIRCWVPVCFDTVNFATVAYQACFVGKGFNGAGYDVAWVWSGVFALVASVSR